jgi:predicted MFS family arabinose efflux permease
LANAIGPLSGAFLAGALGMRSVFLATAALYMVGLVFVIFRFRQLPRQVGEVLPSFVPADSVE